MSARTGTPGRPPAAATPWLTVTAREISVKLRDKGFLLSTVLTVLLLVASLGFSYFLNERGTDHVVATASPQATRIAQTAAPAIAEDGTDTLTVEDAGTAEAARSAVEDGSADAALLQRDGRWLVLGDEEIDPALGTALADAVTDTVMAANAAAADTTLERIRDGSQVSTELLAGSDEDRVTRLVMGMVFAFLFYLAAFVFGLSIANSVLEEKQNRVVEILATAIPVRQLLYGKVLGNSLMAFAQIALYAAVGLVAVNLAGRASDIGWILAASGWFVAFFVAGFAVQASIWAVLGSLASRPEDLQSNTTPITMVLVAALFIGIYAEGMWLAVASFVPIVSSVAMPIRLLGGEVPVWEPLVSLLITLLAAYLMLRLGERIYQRAVFQGGTSLSWRQAMRLEA